MNKFMAGLKHEILEAVPPFIFFVVAFHLLAVTRSLGQSQYGIELQTAMNATIAALVVAKVVLLADLLPFVNRFPDRPLAWNIVWKTLIYLLAAILVVYLERLWEFHGEYGSVAAANSHMVEELAWPHFVAEMIWMTVLFLLYCTLRELTRALGSKRMRALFLGPLAEADSLALQER